MTKRKRVDEVRWCIVSDSARAFVCPSDWDKVRVEHEKCSDETVIRVRVTEVPKKRRKKR